MRDSIAREEEMSEGGRAYTSSTALVARLAALLEALRDGPLPRPELLARLGATYPPASARRMVDRDIEHLGTLGIVVERSRTRPPVYTLRGGTPIFTEEELRVLGLVRETFDDRHPQGAAVQALLARLTAGLAEPEQGIYNRRQPLQAPLQPAIDYSAYAGVIARLEQAIARRQMLSFHYQPLGKATPTFHRKVEPYEIEYYERHFYLVAYTYNSDRVYDFRVDRIQDDDAFRMLPDNWAGPRRRLITFRYRLAALLAQGELSQRFAEPRIVERLPNGDVIVEAKGRSDFFIVRTLLRYAANAELLSPPELRAQMAAEAAALAALYRPLAQPRD